MFKIDIITMTYDRAIIAAVVKYSHLLYRSQCIV